MNRIKKLQKGLKSNNLSFALIKTKQNLSYFCKCQFVTEHSVLVVPKNGKPTLFLSVLDDVKAKAVIKKRYVSEKDLLTGIKKIVGKGSSCGIESGSPYYYVRLIKKAGVKVKSISELIMRIRSIKDSEEVLFIKKAIKITESAITHAYKNLKPGKTELDVAKEIKTHMYQKGGEIGFCLVQTDSNSSVPHNPPSKKKIGKLLLIDAGATYNGYNADITRTFLLKPNKKMKEVYNVVRYASGAAKDAVRKGVYAKEIDNIARRILKKEGYKFIHNLGHGIGLSIHEYPNLSSNSKDILTSGHVFTIEPGIYLKNRFGVRIEDNFLMRNKLQKLSKS